MIFKSPFPTAGLDVHVLVVVHAEVAVNTMTKCISRSFAVAGTRCEEAYNPFFRFQSMQQLLVALWVQQPQAMTRRRLQGLSAAMQPRTYTNWWPSHVVPSAPIKPIWEFETMKR